MARARWKVSHFPKNIWKKIFILKKETESVLYKPLLKTTHIMYSRGSTIPLCFKNLKVSIHKGRDFRDIKLSVNHVNKKFGEFAFTRKLYYYPLKKKRRKLDRR